VVAAGLVVLAMTVPAAAALTPEDWAYLTLAEPTGGPGKRINFGPTGAWGIVYENILVVQSIRPGSPADGVLLAGDLIVGAMGELFPPARDARKALGPAIGKAQTRGNGGKLALVVLRRGGAGIATVPLEVTGDFGPQWPYDCAKSEAILEKACRYVAARTRPPGFLSLNALLMLASGKPEHMDFARRGAYAIKAPDITRERVSAWGLAYNGVFLAEYYLATGDSTVLKDLDLIARHLALGQSTAGTWTHGTTRIGESGYGPVNSVGAVAFAALVLAEECGIGGLRPALAKSEKFFASYAGRGWIPYGDHIPAGRYHSDNGKNSTAAVAFWILGGYDEVVTELAAPVCTAWAFREGGHTGPFFSHTWGPLGAVHASKADFRVFMDKQRWFYEMVRTDDGGFVNHGQGYGPPSSTTGGMAMCFALPKRSLRILGGAKSVFAMTPPAELKAAAFLFRQKDWPPLRELLAGPAGKRTAYGRRMTAMLTRHHRDVAATLAAIRDNLAAGRVYLAIRQHEALKVYLGTETPQWRELAKTIASDEMQEKVFASRKAHLAARKGDTLGEYGGPPPRRRILPHQWRPMVTDDGEGEILDPWRCWMGRADRKGADGPSGKGQLARGTLPASVKGWQEVEFADGAWKAVSLPVGVSGDPKRPDSRFRTAWVGDDVLLRRTFVLGDTRYVALRLQVEASDAADVYLNGYRVLRLPRGSAAQGNGLQAYELDAMATELLRKGRNVLAVRARVRYSRGRPHGMVDVALDAAPAGPGERVAVDPAAAKAAPLKPVDMAALAVFRPVDPTERWAGSLAHIPVTAFADMPVDELIAHAGIPGANRRIYVAKALAAHGTGVLAKVAPLLKHADYKVRRTATLVLNELGPDAAPAVVELIRIVREDPFPWVRCGAADALAKIDRSDARIDTALAETGGSHPHWWARRHAMAALLSRAKNKAMKVPKALTHNAAVAALGKGDINHNVWCRAMPMLKMSGRANDPEMIPVLIGLLEIAPHGMFGAGLICDAEDILGGHGAKGKPAVPVLIHCLEKFALPGMRIHAADALANIGPEAKAALPALERMAKQYGKSKLPAGKKGNEIRRLLKAIKNAIAKISGKPPPSSELPPPDAVSLPDL